MNSDRLILQQFIDLKISKEELYSSLKNNSKIEIAQNPMIVNPNSIINMLEEYKSGRIDIQRLLEWVNTLWFSGLYEYLDENCDSIASVMNELEELDEVGYSLSNEKIDYYMDALKNNKEI